MKFADDVTVKIGVIKMTTEIINPFGIIDIKSFAKQLGKPESTIRTWKRRGDIPASCFFIIGSTVFVKVNEFNSFIGLTA